jgi:hypothetical protein
MFARRIATVGMLAFVAFFAGSAQAFFDPPWITPENPVAGETIDIHIHAGVCDGIIGEEGYPQIRQEGNAIRMRWYGEHYPEGSGDLLCSLPIGTLVAPVGAYPAGSYTLTVELAYIDFFEGPSILTIGVVPFTVTGAPDPPTIAVPTLDAAGLLALLVCVLGLAIRTLRSRRAGWLVLLMVLAPLGARAQDRGAICTQTKNALGAPTPAAIVAWLNSSPRSPIPPLDAFKVVSPLGGDYLIPDRATGDFRTWLDNNPHSARRKLEDCVVMLFDPLDMPAALSALQADPYVADATEMASYGLSGADLIDFDVEPDSSVLGGSGQYGRDAMNVEAAWQRAGGYALVGQIDMGLYEQHPALRQWSGTTYAGGNFVKVASRDIGLTTRPPQSPFDPLDVDEKKLMYISDSSCTSTPGFLPPAILSDTAPTWPGCLAPMAMPGSVCRAPASIAGFRCTRLLTLHAI